MAKVAIFGGSFDPIHLGHLITAQDICEQLELDELRFMPAAQAPMKAAEPQASSQDRLAMIKLAIENHPRFTVDERELQAGGVNYSIDTVDSILRESPDLELMWLIGADHLSILSKWRGIDMLANKIQFVCAERPLDQILEEHIPKGLKLMRIKTHHIQICSSEIRQRIHNGLPTALFLSTSVQQYINKYNLYQ